MGSAVTTIACANARGRALPGALLLLIILALLALAWPAPGRAVPGQLPPKPNWNGVTVIYNSDVGGKIEPCG